MKPIRAPYPFKPILADDFSLLILRRVLRYPSLTNTKQSPKVLH